MKRIIGISVIGTLALAGSIGGHASAGTPSHKAPAPQVVTATITPPTVTPAAAPVVPAPVVPAPVVPAPVVPAPAAPAPVVPAAAPVPPVATSGIQPVAPEQTVTTVGCSVTWVLTSTTDGSTTPGFYDGNTAECVSMQAQETASIGQVDPANPGYIVTSVGQVEPSVSTFGQG
jgi:hypothetical protein